MYVIHVCMYNVCTLMTCAFTFSIVNAVESTQLLRKFCVQKELYEILHVTCMYMFTFVVGTVCISMPFLQSIYIEYIDSTEEEPALKIYFRFLHFPYSE